MPAEPIIELRLLGRFVALRDGAEIPAAEFGGRKVRALLRILATRPGQFVGHDQLTEMLWADRPPADPAANLQVLVNRARRATHDPSVIVTGPGGYALSDRCVVDGQRFLDGIAAASRLAGSAALASYQGALAGFGGEPLAEDRYADWAQPYRALVERTWQQGIEHAAELALDAAEPQLAIDFASLAAAAEPLREVAVLTYVRALASAGDQVAALEHYEGYRRALADELGLDPSPTATALQAELLAGRSAGTAHRTARRRPVTFDRLPFVGRSGEREAILAEVSGSSTAVVTVAGRSGAGKSRLLAEVAAAAPTVSVRAYWPERSEPWSLGRALLREVLAADAAAVDALPATLGTALASVLPELEVLDPAQVDPASRRAFVLEASLRLIAAMTPAVVVVDDLQWADPSSLQLLAAVRDRLPSQPMVLAYRFDEVEHGSDTATFLERLAPTRVVELAGLTDSAIGDLVADRALATALAESTDRTPLALSEALRALAREGLAERDTQGRWRPRVPTAVARATELGALGQRLAISRRAARHTGTTQDVLGLLALLGREAPARILAAATNDDQGETLAALTTLSVDGLLRLGEQGWATAHDMVGEVVASQLDVADRARLHQLLARTLEEDQGDAAEVARHWLSSGDADRAAEAYLRAADHALEAFADSEAEAVAGVGLGAATTPMVSARLHEVRAQARRRRGDIVGAREDLRAALAVHRSGPGRATVLAQLATLGSGADDLVRASELVELAIVEAGSDPAARAQTLEVGAILDMNLLRPQRAAQRAEEALALYQGLGDSRGGARVLDARAMAAFFGGDVRGGTELLHRAANLFEDCGDLMRMVTPRSTRGHGLVFGNDPAGGLIDTSVAVELARSLGHPEGQTYALWHRCEALSALGRSDEASSDGAEALSIALRLGHRGWTATAWRAIGIAEQSRRDLDAAQHAFARSLELSDNFDLFGSWAAARAAIVAVARGELDQAAPLVQHALGHGPALARYEARLAEVELAVARASTGSGELARTVLREVKKGGALLYHARLEELAGLAG